MTHIKPGRYRHYKGNLYEVIGIARHEETHEELVIYRALYDSPQFGPQALWARPLSVFKEEVNLDGKRVPRFTPIGNN